MARHKLDGPPPKKKSPFLVVLWFCICHLSCNRSHNFAPWLCGVPPDLYYNKGSRWCAQGINHTRQKPRNDTAGTISKFQDFALLLHDGLASFESLKAFLWSPTRAVSNRFLTFSCLVRFWPEIIITHMPSWSRYKLAWLNEHLTAGCFLPLHN